MKFGRLAGLCAAAALATGCSTQWYPGYSKRDVVRTDVVIRSEPRGATITFNGVRQPVPAPIRIPVEYDHTETRYERQSNYGQRMREDMGPVLSIVTFPVWMVASLFHYKEDLRRHEYGGNRHVIDAWLKGYDDAHEEILLEGEGEHPVDIKLTKSR
jgi:hypothetical protein